MNLNKDGEINMKLYPLKFNYIYKEKIWGGNKLEKIYNRKLPNKSIGESWEVAAHPHGTSIIKNGRYKGINIQDLIDKYPDEMLGNRIEAEYRERFPLLIKILDANEKLSVQVHPNDDYASRIENEPGKTEMWYILDAKPGAKLIYGLKPGTNKKIFSEAIKKGCLEKYLNKVEVEKGDIFYIPSGTIHALEEGILLAEIQQNSDTTYRVYDWNRVEIDGKPRELHIKKALDVIDFKKNIEKKNTPLTRKYKTYKRSFLAACPYFITEKIEVNKDYALNPEGKRFYVIINIQGKGNIHSNGRYYQLNPGDTYFLPAELRNIRISGKVEFLLTYLNNNREEIIKELNNLDFTEKQINNLAGISNWNK